MGTSLYCNRAIPDWVTVAAAFAVVHVPDVLGGLLGPVVHRGQVINRVAGEGDDGWRYKADIYGQRRKDTDKRK